MSARNASENLERAVPDETTGVTYPRLIADLPEAAYQENHDRFTGKTLACNLLQVARSGRRSVVLSKGQLGSFAKMIEREHLRICRLPSNP